MKNNKDDPLLANPLEHVVSWLKKRIQRMRFKVKLNESKYKGNEKDFTFHGGFVSGYSAGRLSAFEDMADKLGVEIDQDS